MSIEVPYDVIPLPSKGLLYPGRKPTLEVEYLTAMDENILTSPNLLQSGEFVDVLLKRKIRPGQVKPSELLVGDRNSIIIWLRATGYGEKYPVTMQTPDGEEFDTEVDLTKLKQKEIGNGLFGTIGRVQGDTNLFHLVTVSCNVYDPETKQKVMSEIV